MTAPVLYRKWYERTDDLFRSLRGLYEYADRNPDRATGWLFAERQIGQLPQTPWPEALSVLGPELISGLESLLEVRFETACFQAYLDGSGVSWHHDQDWDVAAILSLGVTRQFGIRKNDGNEQLLELEDGDLLFMPSGFQHEWEHCVPVQDAKGERCSVVFRLT